MRHPIALCSTMVALGPPTLDLGRGGVQQQVVPAPLVVCDDGASFILLNNRWQAWPPVPGTQADADASEVVREGAADV